jgi:hypothetical protein
LAEPSATKIDFSRNFSDLPSQIRNVPVAVDVRNRRPIGLQLIRIFPELIELS